MDDFLRDPRPYIVPAVEILILAAAFYGVLRFMRGTRGAGVFRGVLVFAVTFFVILLWLTDVFRLLRIQRILEWVLSTSLLALIVIFWPELRRALIHLGRLPILRPFTHPSPAPFLNAIVDVAGRLSRNRTGALIAIERDTSLSPYTDEGVPIDAAVTPELLETIFYPRSVLHDGAVIIQHGRVLAAGCLFPLSDAPDLEKTFGTRHRAAIGLTEETDAIVVIVSEETGRISVAERGALTTGVESNRLRLLLGELYSGSRTLGPAAAPRRDAGAETAATPATEPPAVPAPEPAAVPAPGPAAAPAPEPAAVPRTEAPPPGTPPVATPPAGTDAAPAPAGPTTT